MRQKRMFSWVPWFTPMTLLLAFLALMCVPPTPPAPPGPSGGSGGVTVVGGATSTGGSVYGGSGNLGGAGGTATTDAAGGVVGVGGTSSAPVAEIDWPECSKTANKVSQGDVARYKRGLGRWRSAPLTKHTRSAYALLDFPSRLWEPLAPTLDQGNLGSCTGNAGIQAIVSAPFEWKGTLDAEVLEALAVDVYSNATQIDPFPGKYPPDDTGSNGESVMRVLKIRGFIADWDAALTFEGVQRTLQLGPCIVGMPWYSSMFYPNACGQLDISGTVEGGHEVKITGIDYKTKRILLLNSWGNDWGAKRRGQGGYFWLTFGNFQRLLNEGAEVECPLMKR